MHTLGFDWDNLKVFKVVAEAGSIRAAARKLEVSGPTVTRALEALETKLGSELLVRDPKGVRLTPAGYIVLKQVEIMTESVDSIIESASDIDSEIEGPIHLLTGDGLGPYWIAPQLARFHEENPKIELKLTVAQGPAELEEYDADIAIQFVEPTRNDLISKRMGVVHYLLFASQQYIDTYGQPRSLFDFEHHRNLFHSAYVNQKDAWKPKAADLKKVVDTSLVTNSAAAMIKVCENGGGIALLPSYIGEIFPKLIPLQLPELAPIQFWMTYTERVRRLPRGQVVIEFLRSCFDTKTYPWFSQEFIHPLKLEDPETLVVRPERDVIPQPQ
jgi:DNA-binding transcriptional LysR family regulator